MSGVTQKIQDPTGMHDGGIPPGPNLMLCVDDNDVHIKRIYELASERRILVGIDLDGATLRHPPGKHDTHREHGLADSLITISEHCPAGPITGRPQKFVDTALSGLLGNNGSKAFAATEGGAMIVDNHGGILHQNCVQNIEALKAQFTSVVERFPGAILEEHTNCSVIVGLTKVSPENLEAAFAATFMVANGALDGANPVAILHGNHVGVNSHVNVVPVGVDKGEALNTIMAQNFAHNMTPIVFGDDRPDEAMFAAALARGGITVGVGPNAPANSLIKLDNYEESQHLLRQIAVRVQSGPFIGF